MSYASYDIICHIMTNDIYDIEISRIIYFELIDFTSNHTWCRYMNGVNPFQDFVFADPIPNPVVKQEAQNNSVYNSKKEYKFQDGVSRKWATHDKTKTWG